ncbi:glycoside hydrolase family 28 protein [Cinnamomum micranthum f. kanehirae]|uniref:Glycoside hydrolase family 28 protein n=1 Tax=Cinnamomum micranthum f. kanehirae TaxID=337451 RepID=A0A443P0U3_9MAGN|nr:glycoside hydrolase family 28 protein [Cinnamomum micranthum f. kanehirae]
MDPFLTQSKTRTDPTREWAGPGQNWLIRPMARNRLRLAQPSGPAYKPRLGFGAETVQRVVQFLSGYAVQLLSNSLVGSLGKYPEEKDVKDIVVRDSIISGTLNGLRIKTWADSPSKSAVFDITYENILMNMSSWNLS